MARYWSTPIKRVASKVAVDTRVVLAVRRRHSARNIQDYIRSIQKSFTTMSGSKFLWHSPGLG